MILKVCDTPQFNISMRLNINYDLEYIEITVTTHNKAAHTIRTKQFPANEFAAALKHYNLEVKFYGGSEK